MSPEQAEMSPLGVDTRTDIYALGVLLYELLAGTTPLDRQRLRNAGLVERVRIIKEEEPPRPSTRLTDSKDSLADLAARRRTEPGRLTREVRGELDWIVMKCLEKDRTCRYESSSALARDIERYLHDEPVEACPPTRTYRLRKFLRRNKTLVASLTLVFLTLLAGIGGTTWGMVRAERERDEKGKVLEAEKKTRARTREALDEMSSSVIEDWLSRQPQQAPEQKLFLEKTARFYEEFAVDVGEDDATLAEVADARRRLATIYRTLDRNRDAAAAAEKATRVLRQLVDRNPTDQRYRVGLILALNEQAKAMYGFSKTKEIDPVELEAIEVAEHVDKNASNNLNASEHLANSLIGRAYHLTYKERPAEALAVLERALPLQERLVKAEPGNDRRRTGLAKIRNYRMDCLYSLRRADEAEPDRIAALDLYEEIARRSPAFSSVRTSAGMMRLNTANVQAWDGRFPEAFAEYRKAEEWFAPFVDYYRGVPQHRANIATVEVCWSRALAAAGDWAGARAMATRAFTTWKEIGWLAAAASALKGLADCHFQAGKFDEAVRDNTTAIQWLNDYVDRSGHSAWTRMDLAEAHASRAIALHRLQRYPEALADWNKAIDFGRAFPKHDATQPSSSPYNLFAGKAETLTGAGRLVDAEAVLRQFLAVMEKAEPDTWTTFHGKSLLGAALLRQQKYADAELHLLKGYEGMKARQASAPRERRAELTRCLEQLVQVYDALAKKDEAAKWRKELHRKRIGG
jgi:tetratricopeptide (TPR) repeat protein